MITENKVVKNDGVKSVEGIAPKEIVKPRDMIYNVKKQRVNMQEGATNIYMSVDNGSTETRTFVYNPQTAQGNVVAIDSAYGIVETDISHCASKSDNLYDNMEIFIADKTETKEDRVIYQLTIAKGGLLRDNNIPIEKAASNEGKATQDTTFVNILSNIGLRAYETACKLGKSSKMISVDLAITLPTEDLKNVNRMNKFKSKVAGVYDFKLPRFNFEITILIKPDNITLYDEAQAVLDYWAMNNQELYSSMKKVIVIDGGGRSIDYSLLDNGRIINKGSLTGAYGGTKFEQLILEDFVATHDTNEPSIDMVHEALDTGVLKKGNSEFDLTPSIKKAKSAIARTIMRDINRILDANEIKGDDINLLLTSGRLFGESIGVSKEKSVPSLSKVVEKLYKEKSDSIKVDRIREEFAIVKGLAYYRLGQLHRA